MEESICRIELEYSNSTYIAKIQSDMGGPREYQSSSFDGLLSQLMTELQSELEPDLSETEIEPDF
tara:strand:+ start:647 stop:841 length:195 start_codon:yes stop_codon:yes gene_type:complete